MAEVRKVQWEPEVTTGFERGSSPWPSDRRFVPQPKIRWLALGQLLRTGLHVVVAKTFGQYNDRRDSFAFERDAADASGGSGASGASAGDGVFDHSCEATTSGGSVAEPYWFDFVADIGDGFNAAVAVAEQIAHEQFVVREGTGLGDGDPPALPRGRLLIMGGDEVYPVPSATAERDAYRDRLAGPYECALQYLRDPKTTGAEKSPPVAHVYAIPGNHDWYDGLGAFIKQFCSDGWIGGWKTRQRRSYFAIRLPHNWWIWGIDVAFEGPVDAPQLRYFSEVAERVKTERARVILCTGYPRWLEPDGDGRGAYSVIRGFLHQTLGPEAWRVRLMVSGDSHFYARQSPVPGTDGSVKIVAGGGGAYLSGTQALESEVSLLETRDAVEPTTYTLDCAWPPQRTARGTLAWSALVRVWRHWSLSLLIAVLYLVLAGILRVGAAPRLGLHGAIDTVGKRSWGDTFVQLLEGGAKSATFWIFVGVLWVALSGLAVALQRGEKPMGFAPNWLWGFGHAAAHVAAVLVVTTTALSAAHGLDAGMTEETLCYYAIVIGGGYVFGTLLFALYLALAQHAKRSVWALFPLLAHEGWKNFLRIAVTHDAVTVYALGLQKVPKRRTVTWDDTGCVTVSPDPSEWKIIDRVRVSRGASPAPGAVAPDPQ